MIILDDILLGLTFIREASILEQNLRDPYYLNNA